MARRSVLSLAVQFLGGWRCSGSVLNWRERVVAAWFGPKGFASVVLGLMIWQSGAPKADQLFHLVALAIAMSIIAHSSTDILIVRWFRRGVKQNQTGETMPVNRP